MSKDKVKDIQFIGRSVLTLGQGNPLEKGNLSKQGSPRITPTGPSNDKAQSTDKK